MGRQATRGVVVTNERVMLIGPRDEVLGMPFSDLAEIDRVASVSEDLPGGRLYASGEAAALIGVAGIAVSAALSALTDALAENPSRRPKLNPEFWSQQVVLKGDSGREVVIDTPCAKALGPFVARCLWVEPPAKLPGVSHPS
jgi:hypothetical protein